jgi:hypothetical protein
MWWVIGIAGFVVLIFWSALKISGMESRKEERWLGGSEGISTASEEVGLADQKQAD